LLLKRILPWQGVQQLNVIVLNLASVSLEGSDIFAFNFIFKASFVLLKTERSDFFGDFQAENNKNMVINHSFIRILAWRIF